MSQGNESLIKIMSQDLYHKIKEKKERYHEKVGADLRERIRSEARDTLAYFTKQQARGKTDREIMRDLDRSKYK